PAGPLGGPSAHPLPGSHVLDDVTGIFCRQDGPDPSARRIGVGMVRAALAPAGRHQSARDVRYWLPFRVLGPRGAGLRLRQPAAAPSSYPRTVRRGVGGFLTRNVRFTAELEHLPSDPHLAAQRTAKAPQVKQLDAEPARLPVAGFPTVSPNFWT